MLDLLVDAEPWQEPLAAGAVILRRFAFNAAEQLIHDINDAASQSPFRQMVTPGGYTMSVAMTNCGLLGWTTNRQGYLYSPIDPQTNKPWPAMPQSFHDLCQRVKLLAAYYPDPSQMLVLSTATLLARNCRCIRIKTNRICARQLFRFSGLTRDFSIWWPET